MNASMLPQFSGKLVCLVGNVTEVRRYVKLEGLHSCFVST